MFVLAEKSRDASVEELIQIADRIGEIEMILEMCSHLNMLN